MTVTAIRTPKFREVDSSGNPLSGGYLYTMNTGTAGIDSGDFKTTYSDSELSSANTNPVVLDSKGECDLYYSGSARLVLYDGDPNNGGSLVYDEPVIAGTGDVNSEWLDSVTATYVSASSFTVVGDLTTTFQTNRRILCEDSSTLYGYVSSSSYGAPNTTVNVTLDSGSLSASLSVVQPGILSVTNPSYPHTVLSTTDYKAVIKTSDETVTTSTTLQDDDDLVLSVDANTDYELSMLLLVSQDAASVGIKIGWTIPSGATMYFDGHGLNLAGTGALNTSGTETGDNASLGAVTDIMPVMIKGVLSVGSTSGSIQYQFAQINSSASATTTHQYSYMSLHKIRA